ncbi:MAG: YbaN family protein [Kofleriaceae bacterium]
MPAEDVERRERADVHRGATRYVYLAIGFLFVGLGVLGAVLPVLPTTPFLLISLWAFSRSSVRFETWLLEHKRFGPRLVAWRTHRVIPLPAKLAAWGSMIASLTVMAIVHRPLWQIGLAASVMAIGATYVASKPSRPPAPSS